MAATTELTPMASPVTHSTTAKPMVASMIRSSRLMGPIFSNRSEAALGASGVSLTSGGHNCSQTMWSVVGRSWGGLKLGVDLTGDHAT